jgi:hypothetical protein
MKFFEYQNYPDLPRYFIEEIINLTNKIEISKNDLASYHFICISEELEKWVKNNINETCKVNAHGFFYGKYFYPHIDFIRHRAINYIIETGGELVETRFYEPKEKYKHLTFLSRSYIPYEKLNLIESVVIKPFKWHSMEVNKIHSVENLDPNKKRVSLTLGIFDQQNFLISQMKDDNAHI